MSACGLDQRTSKEQWADIGRFEHLCSCNVGTVIRPKVRRQTDFRKQNGNTWEAQLKVACVNYWVRLDWFKTHYVLMSGNSTPANQASHESSLNASLKMRMWFIVTEVIWWMIRVSKLFKAACLSQEKSISTGLLEGSSSDCWPYWTYLEELMTSFPGTACYLPASVC